MENFAPSFSQHSKKTGQDSAATNHLEFLAPGFSVDLMEIYQDYADEPKESFLPLPDDLYSIYYDLEMATFRDDLSFYAKNLLAQSTVLELGCGTGRICKALSECGHRVLGVDLSFAMLQQAAARVPQGQFAVMDIRELGILGGFDAIIIAYNTLNLITTSAEIHNIFNTSRTLLVPGGKLLFQVQQATPQIKALASKGASFTFEIFDLPQQGKLVKEIRRRFDVTSNILEMEERYKPRPGNSKKPYRDYSHTLKLRLYNKKFWLETLKRHGFVIDTVATSFTKRSSSPEGLLLVSAQRL